MSNFLILVASITIGILLRISKRLPAKTPHYLNRYVIWVALPATIFCTIPLITLSTSLLWPAVMPWLLFIIGALCFWFLRVPLGLERRSLGALMLTGSLGNTSFVGFPMLTALMGQMALTTAIIIDQAGSFLVVATLGLIVASAFSHEKATFAEIAKRILFFPPFIALIIAFLMRGSIVTFPIILALKPIVLTLGPAALIAVGYQLRFDKQVLLAKRKELAIGLLFKLILSPMLIALIYRALPVDQNQWLVTTLEASMPPMITAAIIANEHGLDEELTSLMVGIGIPLSILTVPLWYMVLR